MTDKVETQTEAAAAAEQKSETLSNNKPDLNRRRAILSALLAGAAVTASESKASDLDCSCLPAPDCNAVCPNGGTPRGDGTQACECLPAPTFPRALGVTDGGDAVQAVNAAKWNGKTMRLNHNTTDTWIPVFSGDYVDYVLKSEVGGAGSQKIGAAVLSGYTVLTTLGTAYSAAETTSYYGYIYSYTRPAVQRDDYGRVIAVGVAKVYTKCACNCQCDCYYGDSDNGCFVAAQLQTTEGIKSVKDLKAGDRILCENGETAEVVGMASNALGRRIAVSAKADEDLVLTQEHIIKADGTPVIRDIKDVVRNQTILHDEQNGKTGRYVDPEENFAVEERPEAFNDLNLPSDTPTYTPIVRGGRWGLTEKGEKVLLCWTLDEDQKA